MILKLHKRILGIVMGFFIISPLFVYAEGFRISLLPTQTNQVISCISFFAHKTSISDLTDEEYQKLITLAHHDLKIQTLSFNPSKNGESQDEARFKRDKDLLEIVNLGISYDVYKSVLSYLRSLEENHESLSLTQSNLDVIVQDQKLEIQKLMMKAREVILKYPDIIEDPNNLNLRNKDGGTYLHLAAKKNIIELAEALLLLNPDLLYARDKNGRTALFWATFKGHNNAVRSLLAKGADPNLQDSDGGTALMRAAEIGYSLVVRTLLENGADPNLQDMWGKTALMRAAANGRNDVIKTLIENDADINLQSKYGETALLRANICGHTETEELLRTYGAK